MLFGRSRVRSQVLAQSRTADRCSIELLQSAALQRAASRAVLTGTCARLQTNEPNSSAAGRANEVATREWEAAIEIGQSRLVAIHEGPARLLIGMGFDRGPPASKARRRRGCR